MGLETLAAGAALGGGTAAPAALALTGPELFLGTAAGGLTAPVAGGLGMSAAMPTIGGGMGMGGMFGGMQNGLNTLTQLNQLFPPEPPPRVAPPLSAGAPGGMGGGRMNTAQLAGLTPMVPHRTAVQGFNQGLRHEGFHGGGVRRG